MCAPGPIKPQAHSGVVQGPISASIKDLAVASFGCCRKIDYFVVPFPPIGEGGKN